METKENLPARRKDLEASLGRRNRLRNNVPYECWGGMCTSFSLNCFKMCCATKKRRRVSKKAAKRARKHSKKEQVRNGDKPIETESNEKIEEEKSDDHKDFLVYDKILFHSIRSNKQQNGLKTEKKIEEVTVLSDALISTVLDQSHADNLEKKVCEETVQKNDVEAPVAEKSVEELPETEEATLKEEPIQNEQETIPRIEIEQEMIPPLKEATAETTGEPKKKKTSLFAKCKRIVKRRGKSTEKNDCEISDSLSEISQETVSSQNSKFSEISNRDCSEFESDVLEFYSVCESLSESFHSLENSDRHVRQLRVFPMEIETTEGLVLAESSSMEDTPQGKNVETTEEAIKDQLEDTGSCVTSSNHDFYDQLKEIGEEIRASMDVIDDLDNEEPPAYEEKKIKKFHLNFFKSLKRHKKSDTLPKMKEASTDAKNCSSPNLNESCETLSSYLSSDVELERHEDVKKIKEKKISRFLKMMHIANKDEKREIAVDKTKCEKLEDAEPANLPISAENLDLLLENQISSSEETIVDDDQDQVHVSDVLSKVNLNQYDEDVDVKEGEEVTEETKVIDVSPQESSTSCFHFLKSTKNVTAKNEINNQANVEKNMNDVEYLDNSHEFKNVFQENIKKINNDVQSKQNVDPDTKNCKTETLKSDCKDFQFADQDISPNESKTSCFHFFKSSKKPLNKTQDQTVEANITKSETDKAENNATHLNDLEPESSTVEVDTICDQNYLEDKNSQNITIDTCSFEEKTKEIHCQDLIDSNTALEKTNLENQSTIDQQDSSVNFDAAASETDSLTDEDLHQYEDIMILSIRKLSDSEAGFNAPEAEEMIANVPELIKITSIRPLLDALDVTNKKLAKLIADQYKDRQLSDEELEDFVRQFYAEYYRGDLPELPYIKVAQSINLFYLNVDKTKTFDVDDLRECIDKFYLKFLLEKLEDHQKTLEKSKKKAFFKSPFKRTLVVNQENCVNTGKEFDLKTESVDEAAEINKDQSLNDEISTLKNTYVVNQEIKIETNLSDNKEIKCCNGSVDATAEITKEQILNDENCSFKNTYVVNQQVNVETDIINSKEMKLKNEYVDPSAEIFRDQILDDEVSSFKNTYMVNKENEVKSETSNINAINLKIDSLDGNAEINNEQILDTKISSFENTYVFNSKNNIAETVNDTEEKTVNREDLDDEADLTKRRISGAKAELTKEKIMDFFKRLDDEESSTNLDHLSNILDVFCAENSASENRNLVEYISRNHTFKLPEEFDLEVKLQNYLDQISEDSLPESNEAVCGSSSFVEKNFELDPWKVDLVTANPEELAKHILNFYLEVELLETLTDEISQLCAAIQRFYSENSQKESLSSKDLVDFLLKEGAFKTRNCEDVESVIEHIDGYLCENPEIPIKSEENGNCCSSHGCTKNEAPSEVTIKNCNEIDLITFDEEASAPSFPSDDAKSRDLLDSYSETLVNEEGVIEDDVKEETASEVINEQFRACPTIKNLEENHIDEVLDHFLDKDQNNCAMENYQERVRALEPKCVCSTLTKNRKSLDQLKNGTVKEKIKAFGKLKYPFFRSLPRFKSDVTPDFADDTQISEAHSSPTLASRSGSKSATPSPIASKSRSGTISSSEWHNAEDDIDRLVTMQGKSSLSSLGARSDSMASVYSGAGEGRYGTVAVRGQVEFGLQYNYKAGALEINIKQCRDLAAVDAKRNRSDPYVKVYLLPDKSKGGKRKTKVKKHTLNPIFDETLKFQIPLSNLETRTLWLTVWHSDMFGRNDFLGEVTMTLENKVFDDPTPKVYNLQERTEPFDDMVSFKGDIIVCLKFVPPDMSVQKKGKRSRGTLHVLVKEAKYLTAFKANGTSDPFCKSYLLPDKGRSSKQKTPVIRRTVNPVWNHTFLYEDVTLQELAERCLELTVWDHDRLASNEFLGGVRFSLGTGKHYGKQVEWMDSTGKEINLWKNMLERPNFWVEGCLNLRPTLDSRAS